jgi:hypothetical protein
MIFRKDFVKWNFDKMAAVSYVVVYGKVARSYEKLPNVLHVKKSSIRFNEDLPNAKTIWNYVKY